MLTPSIFRQLLRFIPGNGAGSVAAAAWCRLRLGSLKMTSIGRLAAVQLQVVSLGPFLHVGELHMPGRLIVGRDDELMMYV